MKKVSYVLSGGGMKGAWSAGVIDVLLEKEPPDYIYGISVGALNGVLCTLGISPSDFWRENVTRPKDFFEPRGFFNLIHGILFNRFNGLMGFDGLDEKLSKMDWDKIRESPIKLETGCVNISDGTLQYADQSFSNFKDWVLASSSIPVIFPLVNIQGAYFTDGGLNEVVPLKRAIENGAEKIIVVAPHPPSYQSKLFNQKSLMTLLMRYMDIITANIIQNDIARAQTINHEVRSGMRRNPKHREIEIDIYRPTSDLDISVDDFGKEDIRKLIDLGRSYASKKYSQ